MSLTITSPIFNEEEQVQQWEASFEDLLEFIGPRFSRSEARERVRSYLQGLLSPIERKNGWQLAEQAGDNTPYGIQNLLGRAVWEADGLRDDLMLYVKEYLVTADGIGVLDETGFLKKGTKSVGVQRQYSGTAGKVENCQVGVFLTYVSEKGHTFLDRELYLPESWVNAPDHCRQAGIPEEAIKFSTKPALGQQMLERAIEAGLSLAWVTADTVYGENPGLRDYLESQHQAYVLAVSCTDRVSIDGLKRSVFEVGQQLSPDDWERLSAGTGSKGPRLYDWARIRLSETTSQGWSKWLLFRRSLNDPEDMAYYRVFALADSPLSEMVRVAGCRWTIEECFETAKGEVGLDQYEVRSWSGWYRHITLACFAHAFLTVMGSVSNGGGNSPKNREGMMSRHSLSNSLATFKSERGL